MTTEAQDGDAILTNMFRVIFKHLMSIIQTYKPRLPGVLGTLLSPHTLKWAFSYVYSGIHDIPPEIKAEIAVEVKRSLSMVDEEYVRSVIHGQPNRELAQILEAQGEMKFNDI